MEIIFIVGVGRSGTSLLQSMLAAHKDIAFPPETGYVRHNILNFKKYTKGDPAWYLSKNFRFERLKQFTLFEGEEKFSSELEFYTAYLNSFRLLENKQLVGDKDPKLIENILACAKISKHVHFIHIYRDPRDVLSSKKKADWSKHRPFWLHVMVNYAQFKLGMIALKRLGSSSIKYIKYETLLLETQLTLESVTEFLAVPFDDGMLHYQDKARELVSEQEMKWKKDTLLPIKSTNIGKWKKSLEPKEVLVSELVCREAFQLGNYEISDARQQLSFFKRSWCSIFAIMLRFAGNGYISWRLISQQLMIRWKF